MFGYIEGLAAGPELEKQIKNTKNLQVSSKNKCNRVRVKKKKQERMYFFQFV